MGALLDKINDLPLDSIAGSLDASLVRLEGTLAAATAALEDVDGVLAQDATRALPGELAATLTDLRRMMAGYSAGSPLYDELQDVAYEARETLANLDALTRSLEARPNALLFGSDSGPDPEPKASR